MGTEPPERNSQGKTALMVALRRQYHGGGLPPKKRGVLTRLLKNSEVTNLNEHNEETHSTILSARDTSDPAPENENEEARDRDSPDRETTTAQPPHVLND